MPLAPACDAADVISAVEFDHDGLHLATGDRGGRVVLFERVTPDAVSCAQFKERGVAKEAANCARMAW